MMRIHKAHTFDKKEAKQRLVALCEYWQSKYGIEPDWSEDSAHVSGSIMGFSFNADLAIHDDHILVTGPPPSLLVRGRVIGYIEDKLEEYLDPEVEVDDLG